MPRKSDPGKLKVGPGLAASDSIEHNAFLPDGTRAVGRGAMQALEAHLEDETNAHPAVAIQIDKVPPLYTSRHVEGALDEIAALMPPKADGIGNDKSYIPNHGIPDWGILKLNDASIVQRDVSVSADWGTPSSTQGYDVFPYYHTYPSGEQLNSYDAYGNDPSDSVFNQFDASYFGGGPGLAHAGGYVYSDPKNGQSIQFTREILPSLTEDKVVVSGMVSPADRGVLALIRFNHYGALDNITSPEHVLLRCPAAILLGWGINSEGPDCDTLDGMPGGIFTLGQPDGYSFDPFVFPGRATGQYNLKELHLGVIQNKVLNYAVNIAVDPEFVGPVHNLQPGDDIWIAVSNNVIPDISGPQVVDQVIDPNRFTVAGLNVTQAGDADVYVNLPSPFERDLQAGQVRLGTDAAAGITPFADGIPILGASEFSRAGGHSYNFFRYRLPYLKSYAHTDMHYLEEAVDLPGLNRFFVHPGPVATALTTAGNYEGFEKEYWVHQIGRYRHQFDLTLGTTVREDLHNYGSYALVHFKKEEYFEAYVRDAIPPQKDHIYSAWFMNDTDIKDTQNQILPTTDPLKQDLSPSYHMFRNMVVKDDRHDHPFTVKTNQSNFVSLVSDRVVEISGVKYFVPMDWTSANNYACQIQNVNITLEGVSNPATPEIGMFYSGFRTHQNKAGVPVSNLNGWDASMLNPSTAYAYFGSFVSRTNPGMNTNPNWSDTSLWIGERIELNWHEFCKTSGTFPFPAFDEDAILTAEQIQFNGEDPTFAAPAGEFPKFTTDAQVRVFYRRPGKHLPNDTDQDQEVLLNMTYDNGNLPDTYPICFHGLRYTTTFDPSYGNFLSGGVPLSSLYTSLKDSQERFLDESYRVRQEFLAAPVFVWSAADIEQLVGPGLPHGTNPLTAISIRPTGFSADFGFLAGSFHTLDLSATLAGVQNPYLQVAGMPVYSAPRSMGVTTITPSNGVLIYPKTNYSNHAPAAMDMPSFDPQFDYTSCSGTREYVRGFHVAQGAVGDTQLVLQLKGLHINDFEYLTSTPEYGGLNIGIAIKVPGLTTWMDVGRKDGDGPSKQDPTKDGAGCLIIGTDTFDYVEEETNLPCCQLRIHLGTVGHLFENVSGNLPVYIKVLMYDTLTARNLDMTTSKGLHQIDVVGVSTL